MPYGTAFPIAARQWIDQLLERFLDPRLYLKERRPTSTRLPNSPGMLYCVFDLHPSRANRRTRQTRRRRHERIAAVPNSQKLRGRPESPPAFVEHAADRRVLRGRVGGRRGGVQESPSVSVPFG